MAGSLKAILDAKADLVDGLIPVLQIPAEIATTPGPQGPQGIPGDDGYTPIKGIDYFDGVKGDKGDKGDPGITQDITGKVDKATGYSLVADTEILKIHTAGTDQGLDTGGTNAVTAAQAKAAYTHSGTAHAPSNAQKNSDILKTEIEAVLTGELSSHTHPAGAGGLTHAQVLARQL